MRRILKSLILIVLLIIASYYFYLLYNSMNLTIHSDELKIAGTTFILGFTIALIISEFLLKKIENSLNVYKRELEKEAIDSDNSSSKIKVLESKIKVLEKALDDALNK